MSGYKESLLVGTIRILANLFMLGALFLAMYQASHTIGGGMLQFCGWFFGITVPIWILAWYLIKIVRAHGSSREESIILLPGSDKPCLVHWRVIERPQNGAEKV